MQTLALSLIWSFTNRVAGTVCFYAAIWTVGAGDVSTTKVLLAFTTGKLAGFIRATPGGIGTAKVALTAALIAGGTTGTKAFVTMLVYRIIPFVLVTIVGWIIYALDFDYKDQSGHQLVAGC